MIWYDFLEEEKFLYSIYSNLPELNNVRINKIEFDNNINNINIIFEMPFYCDKEPIKWKKQNYNVTVVNLSCCNVKGIILSDYNANYMGSISINK